MGAYDTTVLDQLDATLSRLHGYMSRATDWAYFITGDASVLENIEAAGTGHRVMMEGCTSCCLQQRRCALAECPVLFLRAVYRGTSPNCPLICSCSGRTKAKTEHRQAAAMMRGRTGVT